jgi:hypothetical protein
MLRRWCIPLITLVLVFGSMFAASAASAAPVTSHSTAAVARITPGGRMVRPGGSTAQPAGWAWNSVSSSNWSGYAATGGNGAFSSVSASWTEPTGTCTSRRAQYSSFWVGLDGYTSSSVEQTGTDVDCSGRSPVYYGWYEMYPAFPVNFSNTVRPGDHMSGSVTFSGTSTFTLVLKDTTQGWTQTVVKNQSGLARSSAEVIVEAPSSNSGVLPLADFGTVNLSSSLVNGSAIGNFSPTEIIMVDSSGSAKDSVSSLSGGENFSATWLRSN